MGIVPAGKNIIAVREQAERISLCRLTFHVRSGDKVGLLNQNIVETAMFVSQDDGAQGNLFCETARLSDGFFAQLQKHPVPLEDAALRAIANNSQALDIYCWLAYRLHALSAPRPVSWAALKTQFGRGVGRMDHFRLRFLPNLDLALAGDALPELLRGTATAEALQAITDLDLDVLAAIEPPRGYGRD